MMGSRLRGGRGWEDGVGCCWRMHARLSLLAGGFSDIGGRERRRVCDDVSFCRLNASRTALERGEEGHVRRHEQNRVRVTSTRLCVGCTGWLEPWRSG